jgi:hypothetical protein
VCASLFIKEKDVVLVGVWGVVVVVDLEALSLAFLVVVVGRNLRNTKIRVGGDTNCIADVVPRCCLGDDQVMVLPWNCSLV